MEAQTLHLTVDEFLRGPQELILVQRHGAAECGCRRPIVGADIRNAIKEALRSREICSRVKFQVSDVIVELRSADLYEHEGRLCKIVFLTRREAVDRKVEATPAELESLQVAGWVADHHFATPPKGLRIYFHVLGKGGAEAEITDSWYREFPLAAEDEIRVLVTERASRLSDALSMPDEALPECSAKERNGKAGREYSKCRDWCPARRSCQQIQRFYDAANARWLAGEQALANIDPGA